MGGLGLGGWGGGKARVCYTIQRRTVASRLRVKGLRIIELVRLPASALLRQLTSPTVKGAVLMA